MIGLAGLIEREARERHEAKQDDMYNGNRD